MRDEGDIKKYPALRPDLKVSKQVQGGRVGYVVKDPLKEKFFRFDDHEWDIIKLFDGQNGIQDIAHKYNHTHKYDQIDFETVEDFHNSLYEMDLLKKNRKEHNVMLIEKMKEMRKSQLLSKKGSLLYKRFPVVDPDKIFNKIIGSISFFWTKGFLYFSLLTMVLAIFIVAGNWTEFNEGMREAFTFKEHSMWNIIFLWFTIYIVIAIHELGHGLTCKYFGGEVHEIGFLLLFFQPCLYCNVNDAWLFDKKSKQILVTLAGGYIEFFVGSLFCFIWYFTNPNTMIHVLAFQVMTVCSVATVLFNFNPLIKLDGYYLLADYLETPNLRENSSIYLKYLVSKYIFQMPEEPFFAPKREKRIYFFYGVSSALWIFFLLTGLFFLAKGLLVDSLYEIGLLISLFISYKLFGVQIMSGGKFLMKWFLAKRSVFFQRKVKISLITLGVFSFLGLFIPIVYRVPGTCILEPSFIEIMRAKSDGIVKEFYKNDGEKVYPKDILIRLENFLIGYERRVAKLALEKSQQKFRQSLLEKNKPLLAIKKEIQLKKMEYENKLNLEENLQVKYRAHKEGLFSCNKQVDLLYQRLVKGDEICRVIGVKQLKAIIEVSEQQIGYIRLNNSVVFKVQSLPFKTFHGVVHRVHTEGVFDPKNPKAKKYKVELLIENSGQLKPGMTGLAKVLTESVSVATFLFRNLTTFLRMDLFV